MALPQGSFTSRLDFFRTHTQKKQIYIGFQFNQDAVILTEQTETTETRFLSCEKKKKPTKNKTKTVPADSQVRICHFSYVIINFTQKFSHMQSAQTHNTYSTVHSCGRKRVPSSGWWLVSSYFYSSKSRLSGPLCVDWSVFTFLCEHLKAASSDSQSGQEGHAAETC